MSRFSCRTAAFRAVSGSRFAAALLLLAVVAGPAAAQSPGRYELSGGQVAVYNLIGDVRVVHGTGDRVVVEVVLTGDDAKELRVETGTIGGRQTLRVIYPGDRFVYDRMGHGSSTQLNVHDDGTFGHGIGGRRIRISDGGSGLDAHADLTISVPDGKDVDVHQAVGGIAASKVTADLKLDTAAAPVTAEGIHGRLSIDVGSGRVGVENCEGTVSVDTGSGDVSLSGIRAPQLSVDTGSGSVDGREIDAATLRVDTGSGDIEIAGLSSGDVKLDTGSGSIHIGLDSDIESMMIDTGSGDVSVEVPDNFGADLRVSTGSGGIDINVPHESYRNRRSDFRGRIGDGKGNAMIETGSGGVQILAAVAK